MELKTRSCYGEYVVPAREFEQYPLNWNELFSRAAPLAVEIGFGNGEFLLDWAGRQPAWNFVGIELSMHSMEKIQKRIFREQVTNVLPLHEDARFALRELFPANSLHHVMMNFPDPWPKDRHKHRRLLDENFVQILGMALQAGAVYELVTDQEWYAADALVLFKAAPFFEVAEMEKNPPRPVMTKYERKWREMGRDSFRVLAKKVKHVTVKRLLEDSEMPHAFVEKPLTKEKIESLIGLEHREADKLFVVKDAFVGVNEPQFLLKLVAKDMAYQQNFFVVITRQAAGRWLVKLDPAMQPYRTPAVKMAVWQIGKILNAA